MADLTVYRRVPIGEPLSSERLAEIRDFKIPASTRDGTVTMTVTEGWLEVARRDLLAEVDRLRRQLDGPCGSCHPCVNYADETWRAAGRKPPHVHEWDEVRAELERLRAREAADG